MATAYTGSVTFRNRRTGQVAMQPFACTDVVAAYATFGNNGGLTFINLPGTAGDIVDLTDIRVSVSTGTVKTMSIRASQVDTGLAMNLVDIAASVNNRIPTPFPFVGGSTFMLLQSA